MAKRPENIKTSVTGMSKATSNALAKVAEENVGKTTSIVIKGKAYEFMLEKIPAGTVEKRTTVLGENARSQLALNKVSLNDILPSIVESGQVYPAIGDVDEKGNITVWDGSRRRMTAILTNGDYYIYVTKEDVPADVKRFMSDTGNQNKPLSLYEIGLEIERKLKDEVYADTGELCRAENMDKGKVSLARAAVAIPESVITLFPSIYDLGAPTIRTLSKVLKGADDAAIKKLTENLASVDLGSLIEETGSNNPKKLNAAFLEKLLELRPAPESKKPTKKKVSDAEDQTVIVPVAIPEGLKKVAMVDTAGKKAYLSEEGTENNKRALMEISGVSNADLEDIFNFITEKLGGIPEPHIEREDDKEFDAA